jgi:DNA (cytosine-5)-methyltransferase 1
MRLIDLFSGAGGLSLGLSRAGYEVQAAVEKSRDAMDTYAMHEPDAVHFNQDVRGLSFESYRGKIDVVAGGPPCQPFSIGGLRKATDDSRDMIPEFIRCLKEIQPEAFIMENVPGLTLKGTRPYFEGVLAQLSSAGYLLNWALVNAAEYGVPQKRRRLIILGSKKIRLQFPAPTHGPGTAQDFVGAFDVLGTEPIGEAPNCPVRYARAPDLRPSPYAGHVYNGGGRPINPVGPCHTIIAASGGYKTHWVDTLGVAQEYHAHLQQGGEPREGVVPGARRLSVEECAIIQTFPRDMKFAGSRSSQYMQVGNSVPPDLAYVIGRSVYHQLNGSSDSISLIDLEPEVQQKQMQGELQL